jgi:hypothetical protein
MQVPVEPDPAPQPAPLCTTQTLTPAHTTLVLDWVRTLVQMQLHQPSSPP